MRERSLALVATAVALVLGGCASQIAGLAPVGGEAITGVRFAAIDVLLANDVDVLTAPVCTTVEAGFACAGTTLEGEAIAVTATDTSPHRMTVTVGTRVIFEGDVETVLDEAARATS